MPVENEYKFVLDLNFPSKIAALRLSGYLVQGPLKIRQGYLSKEENCTVRVRETRKGHDVIRELCVKTEVDQKTIEIENRISDVDFEALWTVSNFRVTKNRYKIEGWDVDEFMDADVPYFVMAEIELPDGAGPIENLPPFIAESLKFTVPRAKQAAYSSRNLANISYAKLLLKDLKDATVQANEE